MSLTGQRSSRLLVQPNTTAKAMPEAAVNLSGRHLVVALPCSSGVVPQQFLDALIRTAGVLRKHGVTLTISTRVGSGIIDKARDELIHSFLTRTEGTDMLFIDDDIVFEPDDVLRLMAWATTREVVIGPYCTKDEEPTFHYGLQGDDNGKVIQDDNGLIRVSAAPAGFMLLRRSALERMRGAYPELRYQPRKGEFKGEMITAMCMMFLEAHPDGTRRIGEDIALCKRWTKIGGEIWLDPVIELGHVGRKEYRKSYVGWLNERSASATLEAA